MANRTRRANDLRFYSIYYQRVSGRAGRRTRLWLLVILVLAVVLVPFLVAGEAMDSWSMRLLQDGLRQPGVIALLVVALLAADILLPVPSSLVSIAAGGLLGAGAGLLCSSIGMTIGSVLGYWLGRSASPLARKVLEEPDTALLERSFARHGGWFVTVSRAVPLAAESSAMLAGAARMPFARYMGFATMANVAVSAIYALIGAYAASFR